MQDRRVPVIEFYKQLPTSVQGAEVSFNIAGVLCACLRNENFTEDYLHEVEAYTTE